MISKESCTIKIINNLSRLIFIKLTEIERYQETKNKENIAMNELIKKSQETVLSLCKFRKEFELLMTGATLPSPHTHSCSGTCQSKSVEPPVAKEYKNLLESELS